VEALIFISFLAEKIFEIEIINKDYAALRGITTRVRFVKIELMGGQIELGGSVTGLTFVDRKLVMSNV